MLQSLLCRVLWCLFILLLLLELGALGVHSLPTVFAFETTFFFIVAVQLLQPKMSPFPYLLLAVAAGLIGSVSAQASQGPSSVDYTWWVPVFQDNHEAC